MPTDWQPHRGDWAGRAVLTGLVRLLPRPAWHGLLVQPATLLLVSVLGEYAEHSNLHRPHRSSGRAPPSGPASRPERRLGDWWSGTIGWAG